MSINLSTLREDVVSFLTNSQSDKVKTSLCFMKGKRAATSWMYSVSLTRFFLMMSISLRWSGDRSSSSLLREEKGAGILMSGGDRKNRK